MSLRHLSAPRLRRSLLLTSLLLAGSFSAHAAEEMLRKAVGKGAYEMAYSQQENALWVATSQSRSLDKGGIVYRLDPTTLEVTQIIHNDLKPFGATIDNATQTLWFGNTTDSTVTAIDAKTGKVKGRLVLDARQRSHALTDYAVKALCFKLCTSAHGSNSVKHFQILECLSTKSHIDHFFTVGAEAGQPHFSE